MENDFVNYLSESVKIAIRIAKSIAREYANTSVIHLRTC